MFKQGLENQKNERYFQELKSSFQKIDNKAIFSLDKIKKFINKRNYTNSLVNSDEQLIYSNSFLYLMFLLHYLN